jgi:hypothetical protein
MWGPGPRSRSRLDPTQLGRANRRPASALGAAITLTVAVPIRSPSKRSNCAVRNLKPSLLRRQRACPSGWG